ncbi:MULTISPECIES: helix-turn-helix domain-containing protein [Pseudomonas]|uniref:hypothetical protein n=1 Tax=Pseudomonas TaxID=286 RepID=UPI000BA268DA|nr:MULTISPECIES: hypothetical protein [Pseudomonas]OZY48568.1 hypothetical protein CJF34_21895 [Pseudomonas lundensis]WRQ77445.1 hypothetical protein VQY67_24640 [Pseudomonas saxonica]WRQ77461.1 hypothetical protein VQY67_24550 [Pseudomonas saxonica]
MSDDIVKYPTNILPDFLAGDILAAQVNLQSAVETLAHLQAASMRATFTAMSMEQRDSYCQSLQNSGYTPTQIAAITDKSYPTVNRHLNGKNS